MMMDIHRRAFEMAMSITNTTGTPSEEPEPINVFAVLLFMITLLTAGVGFILFDYTFQIIKIMTIVEDLPSDYALAPSYESGDEEAEDGEPPHYPTNPTAEHQATDGQQPAGAPKVAPGLYLGGNPDSDASHHPEKYITSGFRHTIRYLREEAGFFSAWRGFSVNIVYCIAASITNGIFNSMFPFPFGKYIAGVFVMVVVSPLSLVHTHVVLAPPTKETWFGRLSRLPFKSILHTLPAALAVAVTGQLTYAFPDIMVKAFIPQRSYNDPPPPTPSTPGQGEGEQDPYQSMLTPLQCLAIYSVFILSHVLLFIPSMIILYRVQASVYSPTEDSLIPFERRGPMGVVDAWRTYTFDGKKRLVRLYARVMPVLWLVAFAVGTVLFFEMRWVMGEKRNVLNVILHTWLKNQHGKAP